MVFLSCMDIQFLDSFPWTKLMDEPFCFHPTTGQPQCIQTQIVPGKKTTQKQSHRHHYSSEMDASTSSHNTHSMLPISVFLLLVFAYSVTPVLSLPITSDSGNQLTANHTFRPNKVLLRLKSINAYLKKLNKPAVKTIKVLSSSLFLLVFLSLFSPPLTLFVP
uniref:Uncharacterized protein LOC105640342 n=1 Tax=Rhizophora mucronata TaxID=61149 RepID=A0A2P2JT67_RHIMU